MPTACQATSVRVSRSTSAVERNDAAFCSRRDSGTRTSCMTMSAFCTPRSAILSSIFVAVKPAVSVVTRKPLT